MKKQPVAQHMPETWATAIQFLLDNASHRSMSPRTREQIRQDSGCGSDVLTALHRMGVIRLFEYNGRMYPTLSNAVSVPTAAEIREKIREMNKLRDKKTVNALQEAIKNRERNEADTHPLSPTFLGERPVGSTAENWKRSLQERGQWQAEPGASLSDAIALIIDAGGTVVFNDKKQ